MTNPTNGGPDPSGFNNSHDPYPQQPPSHDPGYYPTGGYPDGGGYPAGAPGYGGATNVNGEVVVDGTGKGSGLSALGAAFSIFFRKPWGMVGYTALYGLIITILVALALVPFFAIVIDAADSARPGQTALSSGDIRSITQIFIASGIVMLVVTIFSMVFYINAGLQFAEARLVRFTDIFRLRCGLWKPLIIVAIIAVVLEGTPLLVALKPAIDDIQTGIGTGTNAAASGAMGVQILSWGLSLVFALIIPFVALAPYFAADRGTSIGESFKLGFDAGKRNWWPLFLIVVIFSGISSSVSMVLLGLPLLIFYPVTFIAVALVYRAASGGRVLKKALPV